MSSTNQLVANIVNSSKTKAILETYGLQANRVTWEDTARNKGSCWGPNISDMTLCVKQGEQLMPIIRQPNFGDVTQDLPVDCFKLRVGNEAGVGSGSGELVDLLTYLRDLSKWTDNSRQLDLTSSRDTHVLTSSQCCVLPCNEKGKVEFNVQLFNYQSYDENPAVLVILATKDGTSAQVLERSNQKLLFNDSGRARNFIAERLRWIREQRTGQKQDKIESFKEMSQDEKLENVIMVFQVPLKVKPRARSTGMGFGYFGDGDEMGGFGLECCAMASSACFTQSRSMRSIPQHMGMDMGVISLGSDEGEFVGTKDLALERDDRFPIRCTFQYYRVTDQDEISAEDVIDIAEQLKQSERVAEGKGSLVWEIKRDGETKRITEPVLDQPKPSDSPFGKLEERTYLSDYSEVVSVAKANPWAESNQSVASFL